jgi:lipopolysaccharide heptosyltransferase II
VIDLHGQLRSALLTLATGAGVRVGFDRPRRSVIGASARQLPASAYRHGWTGAREGAWLAYTHHSPLESLDAHAVDRYLMVGRLLGLDESGPPEMAVPVLEESRRRAAALLELEAREPVAVVCPGTQWETKRWRADGFAEVARHLARRGFVVALAGAPAERAVSAAVARLCPGAVDLTGRTTVSELAALVERSAVCVTNDSGPMHLAVALGKPVVSVFGPTDPVWIGPYGRPGAVERREDLDCGPCYLRAVRRCPHGHACMNEVTAAAVIARLEAVLSSRRHALRA